MNSLYGALAFLAGAGLVLQMGMNARIGREIGNMTTAATINVGVGFIGLLAILLITRVPAPALERITAYTETQRVCKTKSMLLGPAL